MDSLPAALQPLSTYAQFILYILSPSATRPGKTDKFPIDHRTGKISNAHDPSIWMTADAAIAQSKNYKSQHGHGVGFVLTKHDPFWFLDIDNCLADNAWSELATSLMSVFSGAAIEISSSRKGLHIIGTGVAPLHISKNTVNNIEFYTEARFVALTGDSAVGSAALDCTAQLTWLVENYFPASNYSPVAWSDTPCEKWNGPSDDNELIARALRSQSARAIFGAAASFHDLWNANLEVLTQVYQSDESSYDAALAQHLAFWTGNDCARIQRLMLQSKLVRTKWEREDYLPRTILSACSRQTEWLQDKPIQASPNTLAPAATSRGVMITGTTILTPEQQLEYFAGCVYICDSHSILIPGGELLKPDQFRAMYGGRSFIMDHANQRISRNAWEAFTESQAIQHPRVQASYFLPKELPGGVLERDGRIVTNEWWAVDVPRKQGDAGRFFDLLNRVIPNKRDQQILLAYMAACVQYKGIKFQWAPLIQGAPGNGKTLFSSCVAEAVGRRYSHLPKANEISAKFNAWMYRSIFIGVEDVYVPEHQREVIEILKPMITGEWYEIEPKGKDKTTVRVCCNFILNSNFKEGIRKTRDDRRFAPFYTPQQSFADIERDGMGGNYFPDLYDWFRAEGYAIVSEILHTYEIPPEFNPAGNCKRAPITSSTEDAITHGFGGIEQEILEAIEQGIVGFRDGWISSIQLDHLFQRLHAGRRIPHNKRRELLQSLGYDWHPALHNGRVNNPVTPDGAKPRLFVRNGHANLQLTEAAEIARIYSEAQTKSY